MDDGLHATIESIEIRGFRSLADVKVTDLPPVAVLIGANGSGKSNVMRFFQMLGWMLRSSRLSDFVQMQGGADDQLFHGRRRTPQMEAQLRLATEPGHNDYRFVLAHAHPDRFIFLEEGYRFSNRTRPTPAGWRYIGSGHAEAGIVTAARAPASPQQKTASVVVNLLRNCVTYQFHDTSDESRFKQSWDVTDNGFLRSHGGNLAAVLHRLENEESDRFQLICRHVGRILPGFDRFVLEERHGKVSLRWSTRHSDKTFGAHLTSDGSLRFFALVTLLNPPAGDAAGRHPAQRARAGPAPDGRRPGRRDGEGGWPHEAGDRGHAVTAVRRCVRSGPGDRRGPGPGCDGAAATRSRAVYGMARAGLLARAVVDQEPVGGRPVSRLGMLVEGATEVEFVKRVLAQPFERPRRRRHAGVDGWRRHERPHGPETGDTSGSSHCFRIIENGCTAR